MAKQKTARDLALEVLLRVERTKSYANLLLSPALAKSTLSERDRALATELVYGTVRTWGHFRLGSTGTQPYAVRQAGTVGADDIALGSISAAIYAHTSFCCLF